MAKIKIISDGTVAGTSITESASGNPIAGVRGLKLARDTADPTKIVAILTVRAPILELDDIEAAIDTE